MKYIVGLVIYTLILNYFINVNPSAALAMVVITFVYAIQEG